MDVTKLCKQTLTQNTFVHDIVRAFIHQLPERVGDDDFLDVVNYFEHPDTWKRNGLNEETCHVFNVVADDKTYKFAFVNGTIITYVFQKNEFSFGMKYLSLERPFCKIHFSNQHGFALVSLLSTEARKHTKVTVSELSADDHMDDVFFIVRVSELNKLDVVTKIDLESSDLDIMIRFDQHGNNVDDIVKNVWSTIYQWVGETEDLFDTTLSLVSTLPQEIRNDFMNLVM